MQGIKLRNQCEKYENIAQQLKLSRTGVFDSCQRYQAQGELALQDKRCDRPLGTLRALSAKQERVLRQLLIDKILDGLRLDFALWSRAAVQQLIKQRCALNLTLQSLGTYLRRWRLYATKGHRAHLQAMPAASAALTQRAVSGHARAGTCRRC